MPHSEKDCWKKETHSLHSAADPERCHPDSQVSPCWVFCPTCSSLTVAPLPPALLSQHTTTVRLLGTSTHTESLWVMDDDFSAVQDMSQLPMKFHTRHHQLKLLSDCALWNITLIVFPFFLSFSCPGDLLFFSLLSAIPELATWWHKCVNQLNSQGLSKCSGLTLGHQLDLAKQKWQRSLMTLGRSSEIHFPSTSFNFLGRVSCSL